MYSNYVKSQLNGKLFSSWYSFDLVLCLAVIFNTFGLDIVLTFALIIFTLAVSNSPSTSTLAVVTNC